MKYIINILISAVFLFGCGKKAEDDSARTDTTVSDKELCVLASEKYVEVMMNDMKSELMKSIKAGGTINAINLCSEKAPQITDALSSTGMVKIRRVTEKNRNPHNSADSNQLEILERFKTAATNEQLVERTWKVVENGNKFTYYKAIKTNQFCLQCHGNSNNFEPELVEALKALYPNDKAVGYGVDELRGMVVVEIMMPQAKDILNNFLTDELGKNN